MSPLKKRWIMNLNLQLKKGEEIILNQKDLPYEKKDNNIIFNLDNMRHTINLDTKEFIRANDEYEFFLDIENEKCEITLKKEQYYLQVHVEYANLLKNKNVIELTYFIETDDTATELTLWLEGEEP